MKRFCSFMIVTRPFVYVRSHCVQQKACSFVLRQAKSGKTGLDSYKMPADHLSTCVALDCHENLRFSRNDRKPVVSHQVMAMTQAKRLTFLSSRGAKRRGDPGVNYLSIIFQKTCHPESVENKPNRCSFQAVRDLTGSCTS